MADATGKSRKLVNILGVPGILVTIYFGGLIFDLFAFLVVVLCTLEYKKLAANLDCNINFLLILLFNLSVMFYYGIFEEFLYPYQTMNMLNFFNFFIFIFILLSVLEIFRKTINPLFNISTTLFGVFWIGFCLGSIIILRNHSFDLTLLTFVSIWLCDSAAFIFGKKFGKLKILPSISPKKTWVGFIAGYISVCVLVFTIYYMNLISSFTIRDFIFLSLIFGVLGQLGDFIESMIKRNAGVKDTGTLLMGHGGVLDRFDSLAFASPAICLYLGLF